MSSTPEARTWDYRVVELVRTVDGDTFDLTLERRFDFGFRLIEDKRWTSRFRLLGVDTWELNEKGGAAAKARAGAWVKEALTSDVLRGQTFKTDNFGRWLIELYRADNGERLAEVLIAEGLGERYPG